MAKEKTTTKKLPKRRIEVFQDTLARGNRDSWNWRRMYGSIVVYGNGGFNSRDIARMRANRHSEELKRPVPIFSV